MDQDKPTQKQIAGKYRGNLGYPKLPHYLRQLRGWSFVGAVVASVLGALTYTYWGTEKAFSTGPISENHARFASDCRACHLDAETDFVASLRQAKSNNVSTVKLAVPQTEDGLSTIAGKLLSRSSLSLMDQACLQCHPTSGLHLPQAAGLALRTVSSELNVVHASSCAVCHREHAGHQRMAPPDRQTCASCHDSADELRRTRRSLKLDKAIVAPAGENRDLGDGVLRYIAAQRPAGSLPPFSGFAAGHPPFGYEQPTAKDPADLKFNHARHLRADLPAVKGGKLNCASCHEPGAGGVFYQPVSYQKHCQECHSLQIQPSLPKLLVPHGDPEKARYFLASLQISFESELRAEGVTETSEISRRVELETQALRRRGLNTLTDLEQRVFFQGDPQDERSTRLMRAGNPKFLTECAKCHTVSPGGTNHAPIVHPPQIAERWIQRGPFTHLPHQHMTCTDCHGTATRSKLTSDILLPPQALCAECHRPHDETAQLSWDTVRSATAPAPEGHPLAAAQRNAGGVKWDCQSCHTFHAPPDATAVTRKIASSAKLIDPGPHPASETSAPTAR